jgi:hypothetical protein
VVSRVLWWVCALSNLLPFEKWVLLGFVTFYCFMGFVNMD